MSIANFRLPIFKPLWWRHHDDAVSTGSGNDRVSIHRTVELARPNPVATAPGTDLIALATHGPGNRQSLNSFALENHVTRVGSGGNDGKNILLLGNHDIDYRHALMRQAGFKDVGQLVRTSCARAESAIRLRQLDEVGRDGDIHFRISALIEHLLPLPHHSQIPVVHDHDLDREIVLYRRSQFLVRHLKTAIADDRDDESITKSQLRADGGGNTKAHRAQAAAGNPLALPVERIELRGPHLVLPDVGSDDRIPV